MSTHHQRINPDAPKQYADPVFVQYKGKRRQAFRVARGFFKDLCHMGGQRNTWAWHRDITPATRRGGSNG